MVAGKLIKEMGAKVVVNIIWIQARGETKPEKKPENKPCGEILKEKQLRRTIGKESESVCIFGFVYRLFRWNTFNYGRTAIEKVVFQKLSSAQTKFI